MSIAARTRRSYAIDMNANARRSRTWALVLLGATLLGAAEAAQVRTGSVAMAAPGRPPLSWFRAASATLPSWYTLALLLPGVVWLSRRFPLDRGQWHRSLAVHVPASLVFALLEIAIASYVSDYLLYHEMRISYLHNLERLATIYFVLNITYYWAFVGVVYAIDYRRKFREQERTAVQLALKSTRLEVSLARANLETLRMQLNPHFLFNTLNTISVLALKGERKNVARMLARVSDLLRLTLENSAQVVPLSEELHFLDPYLEIEQVRFRDRLTLRRAIAPEALDAEVPSLIMQPLVENAVRHGVARRPGPGLISIAAYPTDGRLRIEVRDNGPGFTGNDSAADRAGLGLANTRARLEQLYGDDHGLELTNDPDGGAIVRLDLPFRIFDGDLQPGARPDPRKVRTA